MGHINEYGDYRPSEEDFDRLEKRAEAAESRCKRLEEALTLLQMGPDTLTQAGLRIVLAARYPEPETKEKEER